MTTLPSHYRTVTATPPHLCGPQRYSTGCVRVQRPRTTQARPAPAPRVGTCPLPTTGDILWLATTAAMHVRHARLTASRIRALAYRGIPSTPRRGGWVTFSYEQRTLLARTPTLPLTSTFALLPCGVLQFATLSHLLTFSLPTFDAARETRPVL